ncbi:hypothetical protein BDW74DRAFT_169675 [Aspergillus multicolor]|uniref:uncharacterized protein n=1 Tax=Aspergillus multicolor TaxID=41759 RepID=UPI003CCDCFD6
MSRSKDSPAAGSSASSKPQLFALAHPPPKSSKQGPAKSPRLRLSSRLLLQIQQSSRSRAIPILELYQPSTFGKTITNENGHGSRKIHGRDLYLTMSEMYTHLKRQNQQGQKNGYENGLSVTKPRSGSGGSTSTAGASTRRKSRSSGDSSGDERQGHGECKAKIRPRKNDNTSDEDDVVAVIHTSPRSSTANANAAAELFFPLTNQTWTATSHGSGHYRFASEGNSIAFEWEKRPPSRSGPFAAEKASADEGDRFVLSVSDTTSLPAKRPWLAQLSKRGVHVGGLEPWRDEPGIRALIDGDGAEYAGSGGQTGGQGAGLYTLILAMGVWVARGEGWVN